ncbi:hypothetical protein D3C84_1319010 [compost metagenome]
MVESSAFSNVARLERPVNKSWEAKYIGLATSLVMIYEIIRAMTIVATSCNRKI